MCTSRGVLRVRARRATTASLFPWRGLVTRPHRVERCPEKPVPIAGAQLCPWNARRVLYQKVGNFVGSVLSPILANIYLHELDEFMEETTKGFNKGIQRKMNPKYKHHEYQISKRRKAIDGLNANPEGNAEAMHITPCGRTLQRQSLAQGPARGPLASYVPRLITSPSS